MLISTTAQHALIYLINSKVNWAADAGGSYICTISAVDGNYLICANAPLFISSPQMSPKKTNKNP